MSTYDFVHLTLLAMGGEIRGKTKLQKTVYFMGRLAGRLEELGYKAHYYGPYSSDVAEASDRLLSLGFVDQTVLGMGSQDSRGFEVTRYDFVLNKQGKQIAEMKAKRDPAMWKKLQSAADRLKKADIPDYVRLSIAAKTDFMLEKKEGEASVEELTKLAKMFGWDVTADAVTQAANFLQKLGLVKIT